MPKLWEKASCLDSFLSWDGKESTYVFAGALTAISHSRCTILPYKAHLCMINRHHPQQPVQQVQQMVQAPQVRSKVHFPGLPTRMVPVIKQTTA